MTTINSAEQYRAEIFACNNISELLDYRHSAQQALANRRVELDCDKSTVLRDILVMLNERMRELEIFAAVGDEE